MLIRVRGLFDVTGLALVRRLATEASGPLVNSHEEHTPEPWTATLLGSDGGGPPSGLQLRAARTTPPPPPPAKERIRLGAPLLPEHAHDPYYYPGVNDEVPDEPTGRPAWHRWAMYGAGGLVLFAAGLIFANNASPAGHNAVIETTPADADVRIDGELVPGSNPRTRAGLMNGDHVLLVEKEGYQSRRQVFSLADSDRRIVVDLEPVARTPEPTPEPEPAPSQPTAAAAEPAVAQPAAAEAEEDEPSPLDDPAALAKLSKKEIAKLKRKEERKERVAQRYRERREAAKSGKPYSASPTASASKSSSSANVGFLKINSIPWSEVYVGKRKVGNTPILKLELPANKTQTIKLKNPDLKVSKTLRVKVKPGETVTKLERLGK